MRCLWFWGDFGQPVYWSQGLDISLLLPVICLIFTVVSKLLLLYSTIDKTSPFEDNGLLFWVPDVLCQHLEVVLWNSLYCDVSSLWVGLERWLVKVS